MKIQELKIYSNQLSAQTHFYNRILGLKILEQSTTFTCFEIGSSRLTIVASEDVTPYHFAINIPSNQEKEALLWLQQRVSILTDGPNEIQDFDFWNAKAIYFYDLDSNIIEFIARKNLNRLDVTPFGITSVISISEIGVPVEDIERVQKEIEVVCPIEKYDGGIERFLALGDEEGLFICINQHRKDWFPTGDKAYSSPFELTFEQNGDIHQIAFKEKRIERM